MYNILGKHVASKGKTRAASWYSKVCRTRLGFERTTWSVNNIPHQYVECWSLPHRMNTLFIAFYCQAISMLCSESLLHYNLRKNICANGCLKLRVPLFSSPTWKWMWWWCISRYAVQSYGWQGTGYRQHILMLFMFHDNSVIGELLVFTFTQYPLFPVFYAGI